MVVDACRPETAELADFRLRVRFSAAGGTERRTGAGGLVSALAARRSRALRNQSAFSGGMGALQTPSHTYSMLPSGYQNWSFNRRTAGMLGVSSCGSCPSRGGVLAIGDAGDPVSHRKYADPRCG